MAINLNDFNFNSPVSGASAQINPNWLYGNSVLGATSNTPVPTSTPNPTPSTNKTTSTPIVKQNGGWYNGVQYWEPGSGPQNTTTTQSSGSNESNVNDISAQINDLYSSSISALGDTQNMYRNQATDAITTLNEQAGTAKSAYEAALEKSRGVYSTQSSDLYNSERDLQEEAVRQYNSTRQGISRYGMGSSVQNALSEIVQGEFIRSSGDLRAKYVSGVKAIQTAERESVTAFETAVKDLQDKVVQGTREINTNLATMLQDIEMRKASLEDEKKAMRVQALQTANAAAQQLAADRKSKLYDLGMWQLQRQAEIGQASKALDDLAANTIASLKSNQLSMNNIIPQFQQNTSYGGSTTDSVNPLAKKKVAYDPFAELTYSA